METRAIAQMGRRGFLGLLAAPVAAKSLPEKKPLSVENLRQALAALPKSALVRPTHIATYAPASYGKTITISWDAIAPEDFEIVKECRRRAIEENLRQSEFILRQFGEPR